MAGSTVRTRRWSRIEYERLVDVGIFKPGENLELLDGVLVVREPQNAPHATAVRAVQEALRQASRAGVADYWIVNLIDELLEVYRRPAESRRSRFGWAYAETLLFRRGEVVTPLAAPEARVAVDDLLP